MCITSSKVHWFSETKLKLAKRLADIPTRMLWFAGVRVNGAHDIMMSLEVTHGSLTDAVLPK